MRCVIFCAGGFGGLTEPLRSGDFIIAADGGTVYTEALGLEPDLILGDFDSLGYVPEGAERHPVEKDDTDAMLAAKRGLERGCREFLFYASLDGPRLDHTLANLQTLRFLADHGATGTLIGLRQQVTLLRGGTLTLPAREKGDISVFAFGGEAKGVRIKGLKYELEKGTLTPGFPLGVSNSFVGKSVEITVEDGDILIVHDVSIDN